MRRALPSLYALRVFEVAGRLEHLTRAAEEFGITQGAVSYQIKTLEDDLGFRLFERRGRNVALTAQGAQLLPVLQASLRDIEDCIAQLKRQTQTDPQSITIATTSYFATRWLSRRLPRFMSQHPGVGIRLVLASASGDLVQGYDIEVRWGDGTWRDGIVEKLFDADLMPVCGPVLIEGRQDRFGAGDLRDYPLLHDDETKEAWRAWLAQLGLTDPVFLAGPEIVDPSVRMQAVIDAQGFALADCLVNDDLQAGRMIAPINTKLGGYGYYLIQGPGEGAAHVVQFADWLREEANHFTCDTDLKMG